VNKKKISVTSSLYVLERNWHAPSIIFSNEKYDDIFYCTARGERLKITSCRYVYICMYSNSPVESRKFLRLVFPAPLPSTLCSEELCTFARRWRSLIGARMESWESIALKGVREVALKCFTDEQTNWINRSFNTRCERSRLVAS